MIGAIKYLYATAAMSTVLAFAITPSHAQNITINGSNYSYSGGCNITPAAIPACSPVFTAISDYSASISAWTQPEYANATSGIVIGSHATNSLNNAGPVAAGSFAASGGAIINNNLVYLGYENNTHGELLITGAGTLWHTDGGVSVGHYGTGKVSVLDGATLDITPDPYVYAGYGAGSYGEIIIAGTNGMSRSSIFAGSRVHLGYEGDASLTILDGGYLRATYTSYAGYSKDSTATLNINGVGQLSDGTYASSLYEVVYNYQNIGSYGKGYANVTDGGSMSVQRILTVGEFAGGLGVLNVDGVNQPSGIRSTVSAEEGFYIGEYGSGYLNITNGGLVTTDGSSFGNRVDIGTFANSKGIVNVDGVGGDLNYQSTLSGKVVAVGNIGSGILNITNGGLVTSLTTFSVAIGTDSESYATVDGVHAGTQIRSKLEMASGYIGQSGKGQLTISNGGLATASGQLEIGTAASGVGVVNVVGSDRVSGQTSQAVIDGSVVVGVYGTGMLNIADGGTVSVANDVTVAGYANSTGVVNIGIGAQAGALNAAVLTGGAGNASVNFNHTDDIDFSTQLSGKLTVNKVNAGETTLTAVNDYTGTTKISGGTLRAGIAGAFSANSDHTVTLGSTLDLDGFNQTVLSLNNAGSVKIGGASRATLTVTDEYVGSGGTIYLNTALNGVSSATGLLVIKGNSTGSSYVHVTNVGGSGAQTVDGIKIIETNPDASNNGTFSLLGDYTHEGQQVVVGGAYAYSLHQGGIGDPTDDWYLRSKQLNGDPRYQAGVPIYEAYPQALLSLNGLNTLQQRVGNRVWAGNGNNVIAQGADAIQPYAVPQEAGIRVEGNGVWGRIEGVHNKIDTRNSTSDTDYSQNILKMQAGIDGLLNEAERGTLIGGVFVQYAHGKTKVKSFFGDGDISTNGYGFGGTLTWYGNEGFYIDTQAQATWYKSNLSSTLANANIGDGNKGFGYALSAETGKRFALSPEWSITPQAQLVYSHVKFDDFIGYKDAAVSLDKGDSLQGRLGLTLDHETSWQNANGMTDRAHVYGLTNLYYELLKGTKVDVAGVSFASEKERVWGGIGLGGSYNWNDDQYSIYGEGSVNTSLNNFGNSYAVKGNVGFRVKW